MSTNEIQYTLTILTHDIEENSRKLEATLIRILGYIEKFTGGNPSLTAFINTVQKAIITIRTLQVAIIAFQAASGPVGWLFAGVSAVAVGFSIDSFYTEIRGMS